MDVEVGRSRGRFQNTVLSGGTLLPRRINGNREKSQSRLPAFGPSFEPWFSRLRSTRTRRLVCAL